MAWGAQSKDKKGGGLKPMGASHNKKIREGKNGWRVKQDIDSQHGYPEDDDTEVIFGTKKVR